MDEVIATVNPATGQIGPVFTPYSDADIEEKLESASLAKKAMATESIGERRHKMLAVADLLEAELTDIAALVTTEMGKVLSQAKAEVAKCANTYRFFAEHAESMLAPEPNPYDARSKIIYSPLGVVLAVMPWNFPLWQVTRFAAPGLMAGNVVLLKHAPNVPQTALLLESIFTRAGFERGAFQTLLVEATTVGRLIEDPRIDAVTLTGSERAGSAVAACAGRALKKSVMELGGSDPFIVMPSCDIAATAVIAAEARLQNNGQSCIAAKRFIIHDAVYEDFKELFSAAMAEMKVGDPFAPQTDLGPLASERARQLLQDQVDDALQHGARLIVGGEVPSGDGYYYPPTILEGVTPGMRGYTEELFGPVAVLYRGKNLDEIIRIANDTPYGLGASVFTNDEGEMDRFASDIQSGMVFFNSMVASAPERPFGGIKHSGYGRELGLIGIRELCNQKVIYR